MNISALQRKLALLLRPAAVVYGAAMRVRASRYAAGRAYRASCPVISIGNISWGGTGKTPVTDYLLGKTTEAGLRPAVLTRGYKAKPPALPFLVGRDDDPEHAGDEPLLLAARHPEALVIVDPKRARAAAWAEAGASPDLFILDDGMQHLAVARDLDIVLLKPEDLLDGWNKVIPAGTWREDANALRRAHAFCMKASAPVFSGVVPVAEKRLAAFDRPLFSFDLVPSGLVRLAPPGDAPSETATSLNGDAYTLLLGTGNPAHVRDTAIAFLSKKPAFEHVFPDHHTFVEADAKRAAKQGRPIVCTAKDAVKLVSLLPFFGDVPVWILEARVEFGPLLFTPLSFDAWWTEQWRRLSSPARLGRLPERARL